MFDYKYWLVDKPLTVHWMNYFDERTAQIIGETKISMLDNIERLGNGYFYKLQNEPFDAENHEHLLHQQEVNKLLRLT